MNDRVSFNSLARLELNAAARYYEAQGAGLGMRFLDAVEHSVCAIIEFPDSGVAALFALWHWPCQRDWRLV